MNKITNSNVGTKNRSKNKYKTNKFIQLWLILGIVMGFAIVVFLAINYLNSTVLCQLHCPQDEDIVSLVVVLVSLFGVFIGSLTYYFISEKYEKRIGNIHKEVQETLNFLEPELKAIVVVIIQNKGVISQSAIVLKTKFSRVKVSRNIRILERRRIVVKTKEGMTNQIELSSKLKKVFN